MRNLLASIRGFFRALFRSKPVAAPKLPDSPELEFERERGRGMRGD